MMVLIIPYIASPLMKSFTKSPESQILQVAYVHGQKHTYGYIVMHSYPILVSCTVKFSYSYIYTLLNSVKVIRKIEEGLALDTQATN